MTNEESQPARELPGRPLTPVEWRRLHLARPDATYNTKACQGCGADIAFAITVNWNRMPVDLDSEGRPVGSHFATCPAAGQFRRGK